MGNKKKNIEANHSKKRASKIRMKKITLPFVKKSKNDLLEVLIKGACGAIAIIAFHYSYSRSVL